MMDRRTLLASGVGAAASLTVAQPVNAHELQWPTPTTSIPLWPRGAPGALGPLPVEHITERSTDDSHKDRAIEGIAIPRVDVFPAAKPNGAAVMLVPGGGYARIAFDREGYEMAAWFNAQGITAFVLFYRLPAEGWADAANVPLTDGQRAVRLIRARAATYRFDPDKLIVMGFSAGGHLCADMGTRFDTPCYTPVDAADTLSARPTIIAPIYPVVSMTAPVAHAGSRMHLLGNHPTAFDEIAYAPNRHVTASTPPCFLVHAEDDPVVPIANSLLLRESLKMAGVPVEAHWFERGGHGFGMRNVQGLPAHIWPNLFLNWAMPKLGL